MDVLDRNHLETDFVHRPDTEKLKKLDEEALKAIITFHLRWDHWVDGNLMYHSVAGGYLLNLFEAYVNLP